jgi:hypothetical protein
MASANSFLPQDPLERSGPPERVNYATGVLLQADDFEAEQTYHRGRLAQLTRHLVGFGTLAGLRVRAPKPEDNLLEIRVEPGLAVDRYGRLIEVRTPQCIRLVNWFNAQDGRYLRAATHDAPRVSLSQAVVVDVFLSAEQCGRGKTPSFASGPFDALDALVAARLAENPNLELVMRMEGNPDPDGGSGIAGNVPAPSNFWPKPSESAATILDAVLGSWDVGFAQNADSSLGPLQEHVLGSELSAVLLARVEIPVTLDRGSGSPALPEIDFNKAPVVDNSLRPIIYLPGKWFGRAPAPAPSP